ncbi:MAG: sporulation protein YabP [Cellulosilyticum sp.]|nr:sporulation protein YabP [Cellulosilyticum sp.]
MEERNNKKHSLSLIEREKMILSGVKEVFSFDEQLIELETCRGYLDIKGENLHIIKMNIDEGDIAIEGIVSEMIYHESAGIGKKKGSVMSKLFK